MTEEYVLCEEIISDVTNIRKWIPLFTTITYWLVNMTVSEVFGFEESSWVWNRRHNGKYEAFIEGVKELLRSFLSCLGT